MKTILLSYRFDLSDVKNDFTNRIMDFFDETDYKDENIQQKQLLSVILLQPETMIAIIAGLIDFLVQIIITFVNNKRTQDIIISFVKSIFSDSNNAYDDFEKEFEKFTDMSSVCKSRNIILSTNVNFLNFCKGYINNDIFFSFIKNKTILSFILLNFGKKFIRQWG